MSKIIAAVFFAIVVTSSLAGKDAPTQVINWPQTGSAIIRVRFGSLRKSVLSPGSTTM